MNAKRNDTFLFSPDTSDDLPDLLKLPHHQVVQFLFQIMSKSTPTSYSLNFVKCPFDSFDIFTALSLRVTPDSCYHHFIISCYK